jgi:hypothetical protein
MKLTYEEFITNPELVARILAEAKRERALAMNRLVFAPIAAFFRRPKPDVKRSAALTAACG